MNKRILLASILLIFFTVEAYSYIDPGTGSYLVQIILAAFVGASVGIKLFWNKIKAFFTGKKATETDLSENEKSE